MVFNEPWLRKAAKVKLMYTKFQLFAVIFGQDKKWFTKVLDDLHTFYILVIYKHGHQLLSGVQKSDS